MCSPQFMDHTNNWFGFEYNENGEVDPIIIMKNLAN